MLINLRNALMAGKRLPYDAEVEYLESTGTQYIDTGYAFQDNLAWELTFSGLGYEQTLFGGRTATVRTTLLYQRAQSVGAETTIPIARYNGVTTPFVLPDLKSGTHTVKAAFAANKGSVWVDGVAQYTNQSFNGTYISGVTHAIFADNFGNGDVREFATSKVYGLKMWQGGVIVRDFIPVRKGTVGYLYDRVTRKLFGNAGTGDFVLGPDVVPVEYIESHGTEYIDIPVSGTPDEYFGIKGLVKITNTSQKTKAVWDTETNRQFGSAGYDTSGASYAFSSWIGAKNASGGWLVSPRVLYPFEVSTLGRTLNGVFNPLSRNITSAFSTLRLFGKYGTTEYSGNASLAFGALTITNGLGIERKLFPVRVGTEGAMMDTLTRRIYRNAGTGAFTYGNDLKYPIPAE